MKLSIRIGLIIGILSLTISSIVAVMSYAYQLNKATERSQQLVLQLAENATRTSAIAAYLNDTELAAEIIVGLANNSLIANASISIVSSKEKLFAGDASNDDSFISIELINPFVDEDVIGQLKVQSNQTFIKQQASEVSLQNALSMIGLSVFIAIAVGLYVRAKLTIPLKKFSNEVENLDSSGPAHMQSIDIGYKRDDEIGKLISNTNVLVNTLKKHFKSEHELRKTMEDLQRRFRLIFDQATAGIALLSDTGKVSIANPAFNQFFGKQTENTFLADNFSSPELFLQQLDSLRTSNQISQIDIDLVAIKEGVTTHLHCLFSSIIDTREQGRSESKHLIEMIVYDITQRKELEIKTRHEADHDLLTGLLNRRSGMKSLTMKLNGQKNKSSTFAIMMIDLDKFKPINDNYGHDVGDIVLETISQRLHDALPQSAAIIRWGGDEFLIGVDATERKQVDMFAELILARIKEEITINQELAVSVDASMGIVICGSNRLAKTNIDDIITRADDLMYSTKESSNSSFLVVDYP